MLKMMYFFTRLFFLIGLPIFLMNTQLCLSTGDLELTAPDEPEQLKPRVLFYTMKQNDQDCVMFSSMLTDKEGNHKRSAGDIGMLLDDEKGDTIRNTYIRAIALCF